MTYSPQTGSTPSHRSGRVAGYGTGRIAPRVSKRTRRSTTVVLAEMLAWIATTAVAGALLSLLARHNWLLALPVVLVYGIFCWVLWQFSRRSGKE